MKSPIIPPLLDESRGNRAAMIRVIVFGLMVFSAAFAAVSFLFFSELFMRSMFLAGGAVLASAVSLFLIKKGKIRGASLLLVFFLWLIILIGAATAGGLHAPVFAGYMVVILLGWMFGGERGGWMALSASVAAGMAMFLMEQMGWLPGRVEYPATGLLAINLFFYLIVFLLQRAQEDIVRGVLSHARRNDEKYRALLENIPAITYISDLSEESLIHYVTPQVGDLLGYAQNQLVDDPAFWSRLIHAEDFARVMEECRRSATDLGPFSIEYRLRHKNGHYLWVRDEARLVRDPDGQPDYWLGTWTDITESKNMEEVREDTVRALTARTTQLMTASEVASAAASILEVNELLPRVAELIRSHFNYYYVGIFLTDPRNETAVLRAATGEVGEVLLKNNHSLPIGGSSMIGWSIANNRARIALDAEKESVRFANPLLPLTRSEIALPLRAKDRVIGAMGIQSTSEAAFSEWDIQALQTMADQVAIAIHTARLFEERSDFLKEMESKNAELEQFTYTVSHDLKSPLVTIRGYLGYLRNDAERGDMQRFDRDLERVIRSTETMQELLQDLLELSRVGRIINPAEDIRFGSLVEETIGLIMSPGLQKKINLSVQHPFPDVRADKTRILGVLQNLISNAIKFMGDQKDPEITIGVSGSDPTSGYPVFFIRDNGIGIAPQHHELIFGLFNRLDPSIKGTGIGLALAKRIVEVHGGRIWVESEGKNCGSAFYFTLPPAAPPET